jgi:Undecaprenyl-phosphate glucose phosphotransferase
MYRVTDSSKSSLLESFAELITTTIPRSRDAPATRVSTFLLRYVFLEFIVIASVSYLTSLIYSEVAWRGWTAGQAYLVSALLLAASVLIASLSFKHYVAFQTQPRHRVLWNAATAVAVAFSFFLSGLFLTQVAVEYSRAAFLFQLVAVSIAVLSLRAIACARLRTAIANNYVEARRAVIIGDAENHAIVAKQLSEAGVNIERSLPFPAKTFATAGRMDRAKARSIIETCRAARPDDIVIVATSADLPRSASLAEFLSELPVSVHVVPVDIGAMLGSARLGELGTLVTVELFGSPMSAADRILKRLFDVLAASFGLLFLWPLLLLVAIAIKLFSSGPIFFRQTRHGYNNDVIRVFKFRTMTTTEDGHAFTQAKKNDPRITGIGQFLRQSNIDELPQLLNVLVGDMSIVGPRPHPISMNQTFERQISPLSRRHNVKPGITGWAQVNGYRGETDTLEKMQRRFEYDIHYIENWSFLLDVKIILMTIFSKAAYRNAF